MIPNIELAKPRDFGEVINDTFTFIRQNFKPLLKYFFIFCGFFILATSALMVLLQMKALSFANNVNPNSFDDQGYFSRVFSLISGYLILIIFMVLEYIAVNVTILCFMVLYKQKQNTIPTVEEMWGYFKFYYLKILGSTILLYILIIIGMFFCLIPGIYLLPIFALVPPIMIFENTSFGYAFNHSFKLIKDNWWVTFGIMVVMYIILYVANLTVSIPAIILGAGSVFLHLRGGGKALSLPIAIFTTAIQAAEYVFHILMVVAVGLCYFSLTENKEGTGMLERIDQFGKANPNADITPEEY
jgi:hypothetical protein